MPACRVSDVGHETRPGFCKPGGSAAHCPIIDTLVHGGEPWSEDSVMPKPVRHNSTFHELYITASRSASSAAAAPRRALALVDQVAGGKGDMKLLTSLKFVCKKWGSRDWAGWLFVNDADREKFMEQPVGGPAF
jgi:hypothetical protein